MVPCCLEEELIWTRGEKEIFWSIIEDHITLLLHDDSILQRDEVSKGLFLFDAMDLKA